MEDNRVYLSNLAGTFDFNEILDIYKKAQEVYVDVLKDQKDSLEKKLEAINDFTALVFDLSNKFDSLVDSSLLERTKSASSSNEGVLTAQVSDYSKAIEGEVTVEVNQLAKNDVWYSQSGVSNLTTGVAGTGGTIEIKYAGEVVAVVDYTTSTNLEEIANSINEQQDKVKASIVYNGSEYHLLLSGADTGAGNTIEITETGGGDLLDVLQIGDSYPDSHYQTAQDAQITVYGDTITSSTNTFENVIPGVKLTVKETGTATVSVKEDFSEVKDTIQSFIDSYNSIVSFVKLETSRTGRLPGETTLSLVQSAILTRMRPLMELGIIDVNDETGLLSLNEESFENVVNENPEEIGNTLKDLKESLYDYLMNLTLPTGAVYSLGNLYQTRINDLEERIEKAEDLISEQLETLRKQLIQAQMIQEELDAVSQRIKAVFFSENNNNNQ